MIGTHRPQIRDGSLVTHRSDMPKGFFKFGIVPNCPYPYLFRGGPVVRGRLQLLFDSLTSAERNRVSRATSNNLRIGLATEIYLANTDQTLFHANSAIAVSQILSNPQLPIEITFPEGILNVGRARIWVIDPLHLSSLAIGWSCV